MDDRHLISSYNIHGSFNTEYLEKIVMFRPPIFMVRTPSSGRWRNIEGTIIVLGRTRVNKGSNFTLAVPNVPRLSVNEPLVNMPADTYNYCFAHLFWNKLRCQSRSSSPDACIYSLLYSPNRRLNDRLVQCWRKANILKKKFALKR